MAGTSSTRPEYLPVSLKAVVPVIPTDDDESKQLIEDMTKMGCEGLLAEPWAVKSEAMVQEFQHPRSNEWEGTIRRDPNHWTADMWADVYGFRKEGMMRAGRTGTWVDGKFRQDINSKDGYAVSDCIDPRERRVLEFVVPIFYPEKPGRVTKEIGNTIFGSLSGEYKVSWGQVIHELVGKLVLMLNKRKPTPISPFLFHLYRKFDCLRKEETEAYAIAKECLEMGYASEEARSEEQEESDRASLSPNIRQQGTPSPGSRRKTTFRSPKGKSPMRDFAALDNDECPFKHVSDALYAVQSRYNKMGVVIRTASKLLGDCKAGNIGREIKKLQAESGSGLKEENEDLKRKIAELQVTKRHQEAEIERLRVRKSDLNKIREALIFPGDTINRSLLFGEDVKKEGKLSGQKIIAVLVKYGNKMEATLSEMRRLLIGSTQAGTSIPVTPTPPPPPPPSAPAVPSASAPPPVPTAAAGPSATTPPPRGKYPELEELVKDYNKRQAGSGEAEATVVDILEEIVSRKQVPVPSPKGKETQSGTAATGSEPTSEQDSARKKKKVVTPEPKPVDISDSDSTEEEVEEEEEEPEVPLVDMRRTRSSEKRRPPLYTSGKAPKRLSKSAEKGEGSRKKPKR